MSVQRVVFLHKFFTRDGGIERVHNNLAAALQGQSLDVSFYVYDTKTDPEGFESLRERHTAFAGPQTGSLSSRVRALFAFIQEHQIDGLIAATETANLLAFMCAVRFPGLRVVYTRHCAFDVSDQKLPPWVIKCLYNLYALTNQRIVAVSTGLRDEIRRWVKVGKSSVEFIPNAVVSQRIRSLAEHNTDEVDYQDYFCAVGRLVEQKGFDLLLDAYAHAKTLDPSLPKLVIVGEGPDRDMLMEKLQDLKLTSSVIFHGYTQNPYYIIKGAKAFVLSSRFEGMPTVVIEAMHLNTPVIAFDCPTGPSELIANGENGFLVANGDIYAMATAMLRYPSLAKCSTEASVSRFQYQNVAHAYMAQFQG